MKVLLHLSSQLGPAYIKVVTIGTDVAFSLGESDERIAKARHVDALEHLQRLFDMTAAGPVSLSHKDMVALSGEAYRLYQEVHGNDPGEPDVWAYHKAFHRAAIEGRIPSTPPAKFPVCEFTFGYSRVESGPRVQRDKTGEAWEMPVKLNLFPRAFFHEEHVQPIYVMKQDNEAFYVRLDEACVRAWLDANGIGYTLPAPTSRLGAAIIDAYDTINPDGHGFSSWLDEYRGNATADSRNLCSYVYTLLHTMAHQMMHSVAQVSGLELGSLTEHIFLPDLAFVVYRRGTTMDLGYLSSAWRMATNPTDGNLILSSMLDPTSLRCGSGALCDERGGACPDCILIPEVCCNTRNNLLSRSVLRGIAKPHWDVAIPRDQNIEGYFEAVRRLRRVASKAV